MAKNFKVFYTRKNDELELHLNVIASNEEEAKDIAKKYLYSKETILRVESL